MDYSDPTPEEIRDPLLYVIWDVEDERQGGDKNVNKNHAAAILRAIRNNQEGTNMRTNYRNKEIYKARPGHYVFCWSVGKFQDGVEVGRFNYEAEAEGPVAPAAEYVFNVIPNEDEYAKSYLPDLMKAAGCTVNMQTESWCRV